MQAYASAEMASPAKLRLLDRRLATSDNGSGSGAAGAGLLDDLLSQLADLVADKLASRLAAPQADTVDAWLDTRDASEYLGIHRDSLRSLAAERAIPAEQAGAGYKLFFRRADLDAWRHRGSGTLVGSRSRHDG